MEAELAKRIVDGLREAGVNFVTYLPESRLSQILALMREDNSFRLVPVASETDAVSIAVGATLAGKQSACYMECTGVYVSCYHLLVVAEHLRVPALAEKGLRFIVCKVKESLAHREIPRPDIDLVENKYRFVRYLEQTEGRPNPFIGRG